MVYPGSSQRASWPLHRALAALALALCAMPAAGQVCRWVDESGCVHFAEVCPKGVDGEELEISEDASKPADAEAADGVDGPPAEDAETPLTFESVTRLGQVRGCWVRQPRAEGARPDRIAIYPFEEPEHQYFCFASAGKLYTMLTNRPLDGSASQRERRIKLMPAAERYDIPGEGLVRIRHLESDTPVLWVTSVVHRHQEGPLPELAEGDLVMTLRHPDTGEDLYLRHLRRLE